jgi:hypothetical protein
MPWRRYHYIVESELRCNDLTNHAAGHLLDQPDRQWIAIEFPLACSDRGNDH